jgi:integrase
MGIVANAKKEKYRLLFALCGGTGLRFGEALGIRIQDISPNCSTIKIVQKAAVTASQFSQDAKRFSRS